jgi:hypothetical protein
LRTSKISSIEAPAFSAFWMRRRVPGACMCVNEASKATADPASHAEIRKFVAERWNFLQPDILDRVTRVLVPSVLAGAPSLKATADLLRDAPPDLEPGAGKAWFLVPGGGSTRRASKWRASSCETRASASAAWRRSSVIPRFSAFTRFFTGMALALRVEAGGTRQRRTSSRSRAR